MNNARLVTMVEELLGNSMAAQVLSEQFQGKTPDQWSGWLQNNRNQSRRVPYRIPFQRISGGIFYSSEELGKFIEFEKQRQLGTIKLTGRAAEVLKAFGVGTQGGGTTGRKLKVGGINPQIDQVTGKPYIQIITDDPLMVYRLEPGEAKSIAKELSEAVGVCERAVK